MTLIRVTSLRFAVDFASEEQPLYAVIHRPRGIDGDYDLWLLHGGTDEVQEHLTKDAANGDWFASRTMGDLWEEVEPDDPTVPDEVWTALAKYRLTQ